MSLSGDLVWWEILPKLPFDLVARLSCLCKSRYNWIKDNHIPSGLMVLHKCRDKYQMRNHESKNMICPVNLPQGLRLRVVGESDGILCFQDEDHYLNDLHLYNHITREYRKPPPPILQYGDHHIHGFGFNTFNSDYRIIHICYSSRKVMVDIYKLSTNCWSKLDPEEFSFADTFTYLINPRVYVNGCCYWLKNGQGSSISILTFDFRTDSFGCIKDGGRCQYFSRHIGVVDDFCVVCSLTMDMTLTEVWAVSEYENTGTYYWTKKFTINVSSYILGWGCAAWVHDSKIFQIESSGEVNTLLTQEEDGEAQTKMFKVDDINNGIVAFKPTLVRLGSGLYL